MGTETTRDGGVWWAQWGSSHTPVRQRLLLGKGHGWGVWVRGVEHLLWVDLLNAVSNITCGSDKDKISCGSSLTVSSGDWKSASFSLVVGEELGRGGWASDGLRDATRNQHVSSRFSMVQLWAKVRISQKTQFDFYITSNLDQNLPYKHCIYKPS